MQATGPRRDDSSPVMSATGTFGGDAVEDHDWGMYRAVKGSAQAAGREPGATSTDMAGDVDDGAVAA